MEATPETNRKKSRETVESCWIFPRPFTACLKDGILWIPPPSPPLYRIHENACENIPDIGCGHWMRWIFIRSASSCSVVLVESGKFFRASVLIGRLDRNRKVGQTKYLQRFTTDKIRPAIVGRCVISCYEDIKVTRPTTEAFVIQDDKR